MLDDTIFRKRFKELRKSKGLTQKDCANIMGISPSHLAICETTQQPSFNFIKAIVEKADLTVSIDWLLGRTEHKCINQNREELYMPDELAKECARLALNGLTTNGKNGLQNSMHSIYNLMITWYEDRVVNKES